MYIAGLAAAADPEAATTGRRLVDEYLHEQVISGLDDPTVEFLTHTSVLDHLDAITCDALLDRSDSATMLAGLAESHLFVVPVGAHPEPATGTTTSSPTPSSTSCAGGTRPRSSALHQRASDALRDDG